MRRRIVANVDLAEHLPGALVFGKVICREIFMAVPHADDEVHGPLVLFCDVRVAQDGVVVGVIVGGGGFWGFNEEALEAEFATHL